MLHNFKCLHVKVMQEKKVSPILPDPLTLLFPPQKKQLLPVLFFSESNSLNPMVYINSILHK